MEAAAKYSLPFIPKNEHRAFAGGTNVSNSTLSLRDRGGTVVAICFTSVNGYIEVRQWSLPLVQNGFVWVSSKRLSDEIPIQQNKSKTYLQN